MPFIARRIMRIVITSDNDNAFGLCRCFVPSASQRRCQSGSKSKQKSSFVTEPGENIHEENSFSAWT
jgi:hypothetical protein